MIQVKVIQVNGNGSKDPGFSRRSEGKGRGQRLILEQKLIIWQDFFEIKFKCYSILDC